MSLKVGALCAGYGGLELGLQLAGIDTDLKWVSETDEGCSRVLANHWPTTLHLGDLTEISDPPQVDAVTAGWPCQPVSTAATTRNRRLGMNDERWLIRDVVRIANAAHAQWIFLENVYGLLSANQGFAFGEVLAALAEGGFDAKWACIRADQSVGACHRRQRWFAVAHVADTPSAEWRIPQHDAVGASVEQTAEPGECHRPSAWGRFEPRIRRWETVMGRPAPAPIDDGKLSSLWCEWAMGLASGWVTDHGLSRAQELKILGNGCMPQQAAAGYRHLIGKKK